MDVIGDMPIKSVDRAIMRDYKSALVKLPSNMNKKACYRDKSVSEVLEMDIDDTLSSTTVNKHLIKVSTFFKFAARNGYIDSNPASEMQLPKSRRADELRSAFSKDDLEKLFHSQEYINDAHQQLTYRRFTDRLPVGAFPPHAPKPPVDAFGAQAPVVDGPHHKRCPACGVPAGKHTGDTGHV